MALVERGLVSFNLKDGKNRPCGNTYYVTMAALRAWVAAANQGARDATLIGTLRTKYMIMTEAAEVDTTVSMEVYDNAFVQPAETVLRGNKLEFKVIGGGQNRDFEVPARDTGSYTDQTDTLNVPVTEPVEMTDFVAAYAAVVVDAFGNARTITAAKIID